MLVNKSVRRFSARFGLYSSLALAVAMALLQTVQAEETLERVEIHGQHLYTAQQLGATDALLMAQGVDFSAAGGVSALPVLNGMMGDRIKVLVDGADITAACANQMNPPLSYVSANQVQALNVVAGVTPVSAGGDNIAGVISVSSMLPVFAQTSGMHVHSGNLSSEYRSVNQAKLVGANITLASDSLSLAYQGAWEQADSYDDGNGTTVADTLYKAQNHALSAALRHQSQTWAIKLSHQRIPYQGFANQYMDMTDNQSTGVNLQFQQQLADGGEVSARVNWHGVTHEMGFFSAEKTGMMPMNTDADDYGYQLTWQQPVVAGGQLTLGQEYFGYQVEDWWPAVEGSSMMGPNDYHNIHDGKRERMTAFAEWQHRLSSQLDYSVGVRVERVRTNAGEVQAYSDSTMSMGTMSSMMSSSNLNADAAKAFNAADRERNDTLLDASLLVRYQLSPQQSLELGLARKNRAPNLYERYSWGQSTMATTMIGWFGDGNGYVGDMDLAPETAHTLSATYALRALDSRWRVSANAWYTQVTDYIDADVLSSFNSGSTEDSARNILQFTNLDATLYGWTLKADVQLLDSAASGQWQVAASVRQTRGQRDDSHENLYQIMPLNANVSLQQHWGNWQNSLSWQWVDAKERVDARRLENTTSSYSLLNLSSRYQWEQLSVGVQMTNLLDTYYQAPLAGVNIAQFKADTSLGFEQIAGQGRSLNLSLGYAF